MYHGHLATRRAFWNRSFCKKRDFEQESQQKFKSLSRVERVKKGKTETARESKVRGSIGLLYEEEKVSAYSRLFINSILSCDWMVAMGWRSPEITLETDVGRFQIRGGTLSSWRRTMAPERVIYALRRVFWLTPRLQKRQVAITYEWKIYIKDVSRALERKESI